MHSLARYAATAPALPADRALLNLVNEAAADAAPFSALPAACGAELAVIGIAAR